MQLLCQCLVARVRSQEFEDSRFSWLLAPDFWLPMFYVLLLLSFYQESVNLFIFT